MSKIGPHEAKTFTRGGSEPIMQANHRLLAWLFLNCLVIHLLSKSTSAPPPPKKRFKKKKREHSFKGILIASVPLPSIFRLT